MQCVNLCCQHFNCRDFFFFFLVPWVLFWLELLQALKDSSQCVSVHVFIKRKMEVENSVKFLGLV